MAKIDFSTGGLSLDTDYLDLTTEMFSSPSAPTERSSAHFTVVYGGLTYKYTGTGFHYGPDHGLTAGSVTGVELIFSGHVLAKASGLKMPIDKAFQIWMHSDSTGLKALLASNLAHNDTLRGGDDGDNIHAHGGNDAVSGKGGVDFLFGDSGNDTVNGGLGNDELHGGSGKDHFVFDVALQSSNADTIFDFKPSDDTIDLRHAIFSHAGSAGHTLATSAFKVFDDAGDKLDKSDRIVYMKATGDLYYDADGSGVAYNAIKFAHLENLPALTHNDFHII